MNIEPKKRVGRPFIIDPNIKNLISTWREIATHDHTLTEALAAMNYSLDIKTTHSRLNDWEKAKRSPSSLVINYMMQMVIEELLKRLEIDSKERREILAKIIIPK